MDKKSALTQIPWNGLSKQVMHFLDQIMKQLKMETYLESQC